MPWFKVDDSFESHPKVKSIPKIKSARLKSIGLWTLAGSWSASQLTDGFVPLYMLAELGGTHADATRLVRAGLWLVEDDGFRFKDWHDWQPTKAKVEAEREAAKDRMRVARERKKGPSSQIVRPNTSERLEGVTPTPSSVTPTRPDPTRPDPKNSAGGSPVDEPAAAPPKRSQKKPSRTLPDDWKPTGDHLNRCRELGIDPSLELAKFRAHAEANDRRQVSWNASFTQWLLNARPPSNVRRLPAAEDNAWMRRRP